MTDSNKNILKSIAVMAVLAALSIGLLTILNGILPKVLPSLDAKAKALVQQFCPADDYVVHEYAELDAFNRKNGNSDVKVLAAYKAVGGVNDGCFVIQAQGAGYGTNPNLVILTAYNKSGAIMGTVLQSGSETADKQGVTNAYERAGFYDFFVGATDEINPNSGELKNITSGASVTAANYARAVNISTALVKVLLGGSTADPDAPIAVTDAELIQTFRDLIEDQTAEFVEYRGEIVATFDKNKISALYQSTSGIIISVGKSTAYQYGQVEIAVALHIPNGTNLRVKAVKVLSHNATYGDTVEMCENTAALNATFAGKTLNGVNTMQISDLGAVSGSTDTPSGILEAVRNAFGYTILVPYTPAA